MDIYVKKNLNGTMELSTIVEGQRYHQLYMFHTIKSAKKSFKEIVKNEIECLVQ